MGRKGWAFAFALAAAAGVALAAWAGTGYLPKRLPSEANLGEVIRRELALSDRNQEQRYCLMPPLDYPAPDARSKLRRFGGHADYLKEAAQKPGREKQLAQLDAMAAVGLLDKEETAIETPGSGMQPASRYGVSAKGWSATARQGNCILYGAPSLLRIVEKKEMELKGVKLQVVRAQVGVQPDTLAEWARDPRMLAAFPEMAQAVQGREEQFALHWHDGKWQRYRESEVAMPSFERMSEEEQRRMKELAALPHATREELVGEISKFPQRGCLILPGDEKLPADKVLYSTREPYRFAIYLDKPRKTWDRVASKTVPVVTKLVQIGAVVRMPDQQIAGEGSDRGQTFQAAVYELSPLLQSLQEPNSTCVSLGPLTHDIVDLQYRQTDDYGYPIASFSFKKIVRLKAPPPALADPLLLATWPDLRGALEKGTACSGEFQFNRKTRESEAGLASCWFAFDSYYENY